MVDGDKFEKLNWQKLEKRDDHSATTPDNDVEATVFIPGGGIAKSIYKEW